MCLLEPQYSSPTIPRACLACLAFTSPTSMLLFWATFLIFFASAAIVNAQSEDCDQSQYLFPLGKLTKNNSINRLFSISTKSPVTAEIRSDSDLSNAIDPLFDLFDNFTSLIDQRVQRNDSLACNLDTNFIYNRNSMRGIRRRQIGDMGETPLDLDCISRIDVDIAEQRNEISRERIDEMYRVVSDGLEALFNATSRISVIPEKNWTRGPFRAFGFKRFQTVQDCSLDTSFAYRIDGKYYIRASVTNFPPDAHLEDYNRQHITEYVPREGTTALKAPHIRRDTGCDFEQSTTQLTLWGGESPLAHGGQARLEESFGVINVAARANEVAVDVAEDSLTASNVAILALPMAMNFVPVAFIADLNTLAMVCYVIFTDIFSTLPFLVKGVELIKTGTGTRRAMGAYKLGNESVGQMEIFKAECSGRQSYTVIGIVFVVVACVLMAFGVWLEVYGRKIIKRRRNKGEDGGPFGEMMEMIGYGPIGGVDEDEKMKRFTYEIMVEEGIGARDRGDTSESSMPSFPSRISNRLKSRLRSDFSAGGEQRSRGSRASSGLDQDHGKEG